MTSSTDQAALKALQVIPSIGPSLARMLLELGYRDVQALNGADPEAMYAKLIALRGAHVDRCVLYTFRCAVYYASHDVHDGELLKWWRWKERA